MNQNARKSGLPYDTILEMMDRVLNDKFRTKKQAAFLQVQGPNGHRLYVALQQEVRRVDVAFDPGWPAAAGATFPDGFIPPRKPNGSVYMELDCANPGALATLEQLLVWMETASPIVAKKRQAFVPQLPAIAQKKGRLPTQPSNPTTDAEKQARKDRIRAYADSVNAPISPKAGVED